MEKLEIPLKIMSAYVDDNLEREQKLQHITTKTVIYHDCINHDGILLKICINLPIEKNTYEKISQNTYALIYSRSTINCGVYMIVIYNKIHNYLFIIEVLHNTDNLDVVVILTKTSIIIYSHNMNEYNANLHIAGIENKRCRKITDFDVAQTPFDLDSKYVLLTTKQKHRRKQKLSLYISATDNTLFYLYIYRSIPRLYQFIMNNDDWEVIYYYNPQKYNILNKSYYTNIYIPRNSYACDVIENTKHVIIVIDFTRYSYEIDEFIILQNVNFEFI